MSLQTACARPSAQESSVPHNNALERTRRGGAPALRAVVEGRLAGKREC